MTGYQSKKAAALDEDGMYLVHQTAHDLATYGTSWTQDGKRIDPMSVYAQPVRKPASATYKEVQDSMNELCKGIIEQKQIAKEMGSLKSAPPQRPWVGLTDEEVLDLFDATNVYGSKWMEFAHAVEAKLKEKNNG
jgi:hypothetical protein